MQKLYAAQQIMQMHLTTLTKTKCSEIKTYIPGGQPTTQSQSRLYYRSRLVTPICPPSACWAQYGGLSLSAFCAV